MATATSTLSRRHRFSTLLLILLNVACSSAFVPFIDGGKEMPALYNAWFNGQISKQVRAPRRKARREHGRNEQTTRTQGPMRCEDYVIWVYQVPFYVVELTSFSGAC
jgi:hypothetical protein